MSSEMGTLQLMRTKLHRPRITADLMPPPAAGAAVMASDLAITPSTGIEAVLCGDANLSSYGVFATPERQRVFDIKRF